MSGCRGIGTARRPGPDGLVSKLGDPKNVGFLSGSFKTNENRGVTSKKARPNCTKHKLSPRNRVRER